MEIYYFYQIATMIATFFAKSETALLLSGLIGGVSIWAALFILQGFGLYKMAKNRGLKNRALAFIPFVNIWYVGKLAGECHFFGQRMKRAGMYAMIAQIIATLFCLATIATEMYLWITYGAPEMETQLGSVYWPGLSGVGLTLSKFYDLSGYLLSIFQLLYEIFLVILVMGLYKKYAPKNYMILSMLTLFVPAARFIIIFVLRGRTAIDYEAYMRARREAYMRQQQRYYNPYNNPYNNPYGNSYGNPYGQNPSYGNGPYGQNGAPNRAPEEPFSEFASSDKGQNASSDGAQGNADTDGFFD